MLNQTVVGSWANKLKLFYIKLIFRVFLLIILIYHVQPLLHHTDRRINHTDNAIKTYGLPFHSLIMWLFLNFTIPHNRTSYRGSIKLSRSIFRPLSEPQAANLSEIHNDYHLTEPHYDTIPHHHTNTQCRIHV